MTVNSIPLFLYADHVGKDGKDLTANHDHISTKEMCDQHYVEEKKYSQVW